GALEVRAAERQRPLETAVLVEDDAGRDQRGPGQMVGKPVGPPAVFVQHQHVRCPRWRRWRASTGAKSGSRLAANTASVTESPYHEPGEPLLEAEAECRGECAVDDRDRARRPAEQDRLDERAVQRRLEAVDVGGAHAISAPPPKLTEDRKNELAATIGRA